MRPILWPVEGQTIYGKNLRVLFAKARCVAFKQWVLEQREFRNPQNRMIRRK